METLGQIFSVIWKIIKWFFFASWGLTVLLLALVDLLLGDGSWWRGLKESRDRDRRINVQQKIQEVEREIIKATTEEISEKYGDLEPATSREEQILQKLRNSPGKLLEDVLSEQEMQIYMMMLLRKLGII
jgi:hypothetical protein